jgi:hypothetical protein
MSTDSPLGLEDKSSRVGSAVATGYQAIEKFIHVQHIGCRILQEKFPEHWRLFTSRRSVKVGKSVHKSMLALLLQEML